MWLTLFVLLVFQSISLTIFQYICRYSVEPAANKFCALEYSNHLQYLYLLSKGSSQDKNNYSFLSSQFLPFLRRGHLVVQARIQTLYYNALYKHGKDYPSSTWFLSCTSQEFTICDYQPTNMEEREAAVKQLWFWIRLNDHCPQICQHEYICKHHFARDASKQ